MLIEDIKNKLSQDYFKVQNCTFINVNQKIYKYANKDKKGLDDLHDAMKARSTVNLQSLQQRLLTNFVEGFMSKGEN